MTEIKPRILCVDDEPVILRFLEAILVPKGYEVVKAENGEEALGKIQTERVDLIISDVTMPKMNGFQLCSRIKGDERYRDIPVIIITGLTEKEDRVKGIEAGAEDFISKPIDAAEVLARVRMLLKTKEVHEKRIGELFIEMGFISEEQLGKALKVSKEQDIKVGEALYSIEALDKDHIYWVLSNQLKMNYIELSPEMIDKDLIKQFPFSTLEEILCLPLYETMEEIHFAIADPTDQKTVKMVKSLRPGKNVQLHLALPEKIMDILNLFKGEFYSPAPPREIQPEEGFIQTLPEIVDHLWGDLVADLLSMPQDETYWFYQIPDGCRLLSQRGKRFETLHEYPGEVYPFIRERLRQGITTQYFGKGTYLFLQEKKSNRQGAFKLWEINGLERELIQVERISTFSQESFIGSYPQAPALIEGLRNLIDQHHRLLIGGNDRLLIKQCCYSLWMKNRNVTDFPPPFFIEEEIEIYFPEVAQSSKDPFDLVHFIKHFKEEGLPFLFFETESSEMTSQEKFLPILFSGGCKNIILYFPFSSLEAMQKTVSIRQDWKEAGFKAIFISGYEVRPL